jgi:quinol monooxygenase YgiN
MLHLSMILFAGRGRGWTAAAALHGLAVQARNTTGCLRAYVAIDFEDPDTLHYMEEWGDESLFTAQIRSERFYRLLALMQTAAVPPYFDVRLVSKSAGVDYISAALDDEKR